MSAEARRGQRSANVEREQLQTHSELDGLVHEIHICRKVEQRSESASGQEEEDATRSSSAERGLPIFSPMLILCSVFQEISCRFICFTSTAETHLASSVIVWSSPTLPITST